MSRGQALCELFYFTQNTEKISSFPLLAPLWPPSHRSSLERSHTWETTSRGWTTRGIADKDCL